MNTYQININDITINYYDNLLYNKPTLCFIHGLGQNLTAWINQLTYFNNEYRVIAMDLRGHGNTSSGNKRITIEQFADDVINLLSYLEIERLHFIGLSLGGLICQHLTLEHQNKILSLTLSNTFASVPFQKQFPIDSRLNIISTFDINQLSDYYAKSCLYNSDMQIFQYVKNLFNNTNKQVYLDTARCTFLFNSQSLLSMIDVPTLIICGEYDMVTPINCSKYLHQNIKNSKLEIIPNAGHLTKLEQPLIFNNVLKKFYLMDN